MRNALKLFGVGMLLWGGGAVAQGVTLEGRSELLPGYVQTEHELVFDLRDSFGRIDTYHFDLRSGVWTIVGSDGSLESGQDPELQQPQAIPIGCFAGPWAMSACAVGVIGTAVTAEIVCGRAQSRTLRNFQAQCDAVHGAGRSAFVPTDSGICGQAMRGECVLSRYLIGHNQEP